MSRTTEPLTVDHLAALELPCRSCLFWELDPVRRERLTDQGSCDEVKESWASEVLREWGSCGRAALVDGEVVGYLCYAPPSYLPGADAFPTAPVSPDAVLLSTGRIADEYVGGGLGRMLVQAMARDLVGRPGVRAVEVFADQSGTGHCLLPAGFLARVGFKTHRPHPRTPRMRMEMRTLVPWRSEVEAALERLVGAVRPAKPPAPATPASREGGPRYAGRDLVPRSRRYSTCPADPQCCSFLAALRAGQMNSSSSLRSAAFGRAPTMVRTTSPPW